MASKRYVSEYFAMRSLQACFVLCAMSRSDTLVAIEVLFCLGEDRRYENAGTSGSHPAIKP